jgi:hypothetical protein
MNILSIYYQLLLLADKLIVNNLVLYYLVTKITDKIGRNQYEYRR